MVDINSTIPLIEPLSKTVGSLMAILQILVGGLFGLAVIMFIFRIISSRKLSKQMDKLFKEISGVKKRLGVIEKKLNKKK